MNQVDKQGRVLIIVYWVRVRVRVWVRVRVRPIKQVVVCHLMRAQPYPSLVVPLRRLQAQMKDNTPDKHRQNDKKDTEHTAQTDP